MCSTIIFLLVFLKYLFSLFYCLNHFFFIIFFTVFTRNANDNLLINIIIEKIFIFLTMQKIKKINQKYNFISALIKLFLKTNCLDPTLNNSNK